MPSLSLSILVYNTLLSTHVPLDFLISLAHPRDDKKFLLMLVHSKQCFIFYLVDQVVLRIMLIVVRVNM